MKKLLATLLAAALLLAGLSALAEADALAAAFDGLFDGVTDATANGEDQYRVYVRDPDGNPVEGAMIQFCDDATCAFQPTDADGVAAFATDAAGVYEVHVLQAPEGFRQDETVYRTLDVFCDVNILLERDK